MPKLQPRNALLEPSQSFKNKYLSCVENLKLNETKTIKEFVNFDIKFSENLITNPNYIKFDLLLID